MIDVFSWFDPAEKINGKLSNDGMLIALAQSLSLRCKLEAKENGFLSEGIKFFNFIKNKHVEK